MSLDPATVIRRMGVVSAQVGAVLHAPPPYSIIGLLLEQRESNIKITATKQRGVLLSLKGSRGHQSNLGLHQ